MPDPLIDKREKAMAWLLSLIFSPAQREQWPFTADDVARTIVVSLPPDWCGHEREIARLKGIEAAVLAGGHGVCTCEGWPRPPDADKASHYVDCDYDPDLRTALEP